MTREETLRNHEFVRGLADCHIARLAEIATEVEFAVSEIILAEGEQSEYFYLVLEGTVSVELRTPGEPLP